MIHSRKQRRKNRVRRRIASSIKHPRLSVHRSNKHMYVQVIDDVEGKTVAFAHDLQIEGKMTKTKRAQAVGEKIAHKLIKLKIKRVVFDRGGFKYGGRVQMLAQAVRESGIKI